MIALITSGIAAGALSLGSCGPKKAPQSQTSARPAEAVQQQPAAAPIKAAVIKPIEAKDKETIFQKEDKRKDCGSTSAPCDGDSFQMDIKKEVKTDLDKENGVTSTFCAGGCAKKSAFKWSLDW